MLKVNSSSIVLNCALLVNDGTKDDFLDQWDEETNNLKKDMAEYALEDYEDAADQAMAALLNYKEEVKEDPNSKKARTAIRRKRGN